MLWRVLDLVIFIVLLVMFIIGSVTFSIGSFIIGMKPYEGGVIGLGRTNWCILTSGVVRIW